MHHRSISHSCTATRSAGTRHSTLGQSSIPLFFLIILPNCACSIYSKIRGISLAPCFSRQISPEPLSRFGELDGLLDRNHLVHWQVCNRENPDHTPNSRSAAKTNGTNRDDRSRALPSSCSYARYPCPRERSPISQFHCTGHEPKIPVQTSRSITDADREKR